MEYDRPRLAKRYVPRDSVTVAFLIEACPVAYGVVKNISASGACIISDARLLESHDLDMTMSFSRLGMIGAEARLVWSSVDDAIHAVDYGVQFTGFSARDQRRFEQILESPTFEIPRA